MSNGPAPTTLIEILDSRSLRFGENRIARVDVGVDFGFPTAAYVARVGLLNGVFEELYLIDRADLGTAEPLDPNALADRVQSLVGSLAGPRLTWFVSSRFSQPQAGAYALGSELFCVTPGDFLGRILAIPETASEDFCVVNRTDPDTVLSTFQARRARPLKYDGRSFVVSAGVPLGDQLESWAGSDNPPLLLLGDRGSGKTWQLLKFCIDQNRRHQLSPATNPPALYLSLRGFAAEARRGTSFDLFTLTSQRYRWLKVKWNEPMFRALMAHGRVVICLDGLDECAQQPTNREVEEHVADLFRLVPQGGRLILTSRMTHFESLEALGKVRTWADSFIGESMKVLELQPLSDSDVAAYLQAVKHVGRPAQESLLALNENQDELSRALLRCARQPGLLAFLRFQAPRDAGRLELLRGAIEGALVDFNLDAGRTRALHQDSEGNLHTFDNARRVALLGELAWFSAERRLKDLSLSNLPARVTRLFGVASDSLQRDLRSQTVFEFVDRSDSTVPRVRFGIRYASPGSRDLLPGKTSPGISVAEAYFLARHLHRRLCDHFNSDSIPVEAALGFLGSVKLTRLAGAILEEILRQSGPDPKWLARAARESLVAMARRKKFQVFAAPYRFLIGNLVAAGCMEEVDRRDIDPWFSSPFDALSPAGAQGYEMVLVPPCDSPEIRRWARSRQGCHSSLKDTRLPYLLGLHEVTNADFLRFVDSPDGMDWSVEAVTKAGSPDGQPTSPFASMTNEYHLYFWDKTAEQQSFRPDKQMLRHPVVYVSWYAAQAFCDWLSKLDNRGSLGELAARRGRSSHTLQASRKPGYRLPTAVEWRWAAQGPHLNAKYPWDLAPYPRRTQGKEPEARWAVEYRSAAREVLMSSTERSKDVLYDDELSIFGLAGLIGNVKEWVHDTFRVRSRLEHALVLGATSHLGLKSFEFGYAAPLYPENTNPDVGFRVARSLSDDELVALRNREGEIAQR